MRYCYIPGGIVYSTYKCVEFIVSEDLNSPTYVVDSNRNILVCTYPPSTNLSDLSTIIDVKTDGVMTVTGLVKLYPKITINGLNIYITNVMNDSTCLFSIFLDTDSTEFTYDENVVGEWLVIPSEYRAITDNVTAYVVNLINTKSVRIYVESDSFTVSNIPPTDLHVSKPLYVDYVNIIPYGVYTKLYLTESNIIDGFITACKAKFPEIEFFPQSSERKNRGKETVYYKSAISQTKSSRFNSTLLESPERGRFFLTTIPIEVYYQTSSIDQYIQRRDAFLMSRFLMDVHDFTVTKTRAYPDETGSYEETFNFSTYWERHSIQDEMIKADATDGSGRDCFTIPTVCDLICFIIEKSVETRPVTEVITSVYINKLQVQTHSTND